jgi:twitching motility protein PilT
MSNEDDKARIDSLTDYDCSWSASGIGRFRVNILKQRSSFMVVMRVIPFEVPTFEKLRLPAALARVAESERGMVLVTGVTGSGKSSTMAAMVNYINANENRHILTLENPIEFLHTDIMSAVTQREVGSDTMDFKMGLRAALRQDPDVVMIGEMRDAETIDTAIKAAETGHLLISTLHTPDAQSTILRIMAMFPPEEQEVVRVRLSETLQAVVSQRLLPRADGNGRAVAAEILIVTPAVRDMIADGKRIGEIRDYIAEGRDQYGMQTFDQHLADLVQEGVVTFDTAMAASTNPSDFELKMRMFSRRSASEPSGSGAASGTPSGAAAPSNPDGVTQGAAFDFLS